MDESIKGNLAVGAKIQVPELAPGPNAQPLYLYPDKIQEAHDNVEVSGSIPRQEPGSRMVLFLKLVPPIHQKSGGWAPSDAMKSMKASVVWIHGDSLYWFSQPYNPGPSILTRSILGETELREKISQILKQQALENEISRLKNSKNDR